MERYLFDLQASSLDEHRGSKFFELLLHQIPRKMQQNLEKILLPDSEMNYKSSKIHAAKQDSAIPSLFAALLPGEHSGEAPEVWREQWYAHCAEQAQRSADSCWRLLKDLGLSHYVQESYFQNCYRESSLYLERELRGEFVILLQSDPHYPSGLQGLQQAPRLLFWRGRFLPPEAQSTAIIGTRRAGSWGMHQAWQEALLLQKEQTAKHVRSKSIEHWIVSGLAHGCDQAAHRGALDGGGPTLALLPGGFDHIYPKQHQGLAREIVDSDGALVSEYVPSADPMKWRFIQRDRLQSAIAQRILLIESPLDGGSMHAVRAALHLGKPVFTLQGTETCWQITAADMKAEAKAKKDLKGAVQLEKTASLFLLGEEQVDEALLGANQLLLREKRAQLWPSQGES